MTIVCDICGNVYKDKQPGYYVTGTICNKCYNLKDIDELKNVVKQRIERTKKRLKVLEELGFEMTEIKGDLDSFEELLEKEVVVAVFKNKIINFFTKVSTRETGFLFKGIEDKIPEFINENEKLANEKEKLENQLENLKNREVELTDQINNLSKEIEGLNETTNTLTNENKELKNQIKQLEKLKGKEVELTDQINRLNKEIKGLNETTNTLTNENKELKNQINQLENLKGKEVEFKDQINSLNKEIEELNKNTGTLTNENKKLKNQIKTTEKKLKDIKGQKREEGFQDDFSDKSSGWGETSDEDAEYKYEDGEYHVLVKKKKWATGSNTQGAYSDFILEVDARQVSGPVGYYGLHFREDAAGNFYRFSVSGNSYRIAKWFGKSGWETFKDWTKSKHIKKGKEINRLKVIAYGSQIMVFVNDEYLATVTDFSIVKGGVCMIAGTWDETNVHVHFDNFKVLPIG